MLNVKVEFPKREMKKILSELERSSSDLAAYVAEAGIPQPEERGEQTPPAQYMYYQDRGYWAGATYVEPSPWFSGTINNKSSDWLSVYKQGVPLVLEGKVKAQALALQAASNMRNDFLRGITNFDLIDTGDARRSVAFRVVGYGGKTPRWTK